ncbi:MAG TPA: transposase [Gemmatimonadaceae bacterium]|nr:transposase [Gemmatimonadaceae bacterium]
MAVRRKYSAEFRFEAVRLMRQRIAAGESLSRVGEELNIKPDILRLWSKEIDAAPDGATPQEVFPGKGKYRSYTPKIGASSASSEIDAESPAEELKRLRRENDLLRRERDFLKKAAAFFAKESQ